MTEYPNFSDLQGKTLKDVRQIGDDRLEFECEDGSVYALLHNQDCCESVNIESIVGDLSDLTGTPILLAEEATSHDAPEDRKPDEYPGESETWTFYKLATIKGSVTIRWFGSSNGYYSESVDFAEAA